MQRVIGTKRNLILAAILVSTGLFAGDAPPAALPNNVDADVKNVVETIQSLSGMLSSLDTAANALAEGDAVKTAPDGKQDGKVDKQGRPLKNTIAIITAGAAAGASIGAATKKGTQAIVIGAIAGAAAGLIYDRMTAEKKTQPEPDAAPKTPETAKPEITKESGKPAPVALTPAG